MPYSFQEVIDRTKASMGDVVDVLQAGFNAATDAGEKFAFMNMLNRVRHVVGDLFGSAAVAVATQPANNPVALLASAARTTTTASADQVNTLAKGVIVVLDLTAFVTAASLVLVVQRKNADGTYTDIAVAPAALAAVGKQVVGIGGGFGVENAGINDLVNGALPRDWRINVTHANGNSHTYSISAVLVR